MKPAVIILFSIVALVLTELSHAHTFIVLSIRQFFATSYQQKCIKKVLDRQGCPHIFALPKNERPVRLRARTPPFHGGDTGSNPVRGTKRPNWEKELRATPVGVALFFM